MAPDPSPRNQNPIVTVAGTQLTPEQAVQLEEVRIEHAVRTPSVAILRFEDPDYVIAESREFSIGLACVVSVTTETVAGQQNDVVVFDGEITAVEIDHAPGQPADFVVECLDRSHRLTRTPHVASYIDQKFSDVVSTIASDHNLSADTTPTSTTHAHLLQSSTDYDFVTTLAERVGYEWWVDGTSLVFKPLATSETVTVDRSEVRSLTLRTAAVGSDKIEVRGWDPVAQEAVVSNEYLRDGAAIRPAAGTNYDGDSEEVFQSRRADASLASGFGPRSTQEAGELAASIRDRESASEITGRGVLHRCWPALRPGAELAIENAGPSGGTYPITKVVHLFRAGEGFTTRFRAGGRGGHSLVDTLNGKAWAPDMLQHTGLTVGIVTNNNDDENLGRVKVKYPTLSDETDSGWARVVSMGGGAGRGSHFTPEVDDEVLVGFEHGDLRSPVVLGGLWGTRNAAPDGVDTAVSNSGVVARRITSRLGSVFELEDGDAPEAEGIGMRIDGDQKKWRLYKDEYRLEGPSKYPIIVKAGSSEVTIDDSGNIVLNAGEGNASVTIEAAKDVTIKGSMNVSIEAGTKLELKAGAAKLELGPSGATLDGGSMTNVKGGMVNIN